MKVLSLGVMVVACATAGCGAASPPGRQPCAAIQTLGVREREAPASFLAPASPNDARCFTRAIAGGCLGDDVATMPRGTLLDDVEAVCWIVLDQPYCHAPDLSEVLELCAPRDLSLVVPWEGDCADARHEVSVIFRRGTDEALTASTALALRHAAAVSGMALSPAIVRRLEEATLAERSPGELQLLWRAQYCQHGAGSAAMGTVAIDAIACGTVIAE